MDPTVSAGIHPPTTKKRRRGAPTTINALGNDVLCMVFAFLDLVHLIRCSAVCRSWSIVIDKLKLLQIQYHKQHQTDSVSVSGASNFSERLINRQMEQLAMDRQRLSLQEGPVDVFQWKAHSVGNGIGFRSAAILRRIAAKVKEECEIRTQKAFYADSCKQNIFDTAWFILRFSKCRMKMGMVLTGVGDKVMRLWSAESCKGLDEYFLPDKAPLIDFDFDEGKVVGLVGTRVCIWKRVGTRDLFSSREGLFTRGLCMRYVDPQAVVGCEDGKIRVFDMYSRKTSQIIKMHPGAVSCLCFTDEQLIISGSSLGRISISDLSSAQQVATLETTGSADFTSVRKNRKKQLAKADLHNLEDGASKSVKIWKEGIKTLCLDPNSYSLFAGSSTGCASCWDLRTLRRRWETRVSPNVLYSAHHLRNDDSTLVVGGIDGVLRIVDQGSGEVLSRCIMEENRNMSNRSKDKNGVVEKKKTIRLAEDDRIDLMPNRPPITCLAVGMQKVVTTHNDRYIRVWKFGNK